MLRGRDFLRESSAFLVPHGASNRCALEAPGLNGVRGEYTRFDLSDDGAEFDVWSISYVRRF